MTTGGVCKIEIESLKQELKCDIKPELAIKSEPGLSCRHLKDDSYFVEDVRDQEYCRSSSITDDVSTSNRLNSPVSDRYSNCDSSEMILPDFQNQQTLLTPVKSSEIFQKDKKSRPRRSYRCKYCPSVLYTEASDLQEHAMNVHPDTVKPERPFKCDLCSFSSVQFYSLIDHEKKHHDEPEYSLDHDGKIIKPFKCDQCGSAFISKQKLIAHQRVHTEERLFKCEYCSSSYYDKSGLKSHLYSHTKEKSFKCDQCSFACISKYRLFMHQKTHSDEKPYKCEECLKSFAYKHGLIVHQRTHSGLKPFKCDQCPYTCTRKCYLKSHKRVHSGEKPFKCVHCPYAAASKSSLNSHRSKHHPY